MRVIRETVVIPFIALAYFGEICACVVDWLLKCREQDRI